MGQHTAVVSEHRAGPAARRSGTVLVGAVAAGALALGALAQAQEAGATCLSVSGLSISSGCTSTFGDMAVAIGPGAKASATGGVFGTAFAIGPSSSADASGVLATGIALGPGALARGIGTNAHALAVGNDVAGGGALTGGNNDDAFAIGTNTLASAGDGNNQKAIAIGSHSTVYQLAGDNGSAILLGSYSTIEDGDSNNHSIVFGNHSHAVAIYGTHNTAIVLGDYSFRALEETVRPSPITAIPPSCWVTTAPQAQAQAARITSSLWATVKPRTSLSSCFSALSIGQPFGPSSLWWRADCVLLPSRAAV